MNGKKQARSPRRTVVPWKATRRTPQGAEPGTLRADPAALQPILEILSYGPDGMEEHPIHELEALHDGLSRWPVNWINVDGLGNVETVRRLGELFHLHPLAQEDVLNTYQRAKAEAYGDLLFIVLRMCYLKDGVLESEQLSLYLGGNFVLTFQEVPGDCLGPVRRRIRRGDGRIRQLGPDYLAYALIDAVIDAYFPILERAGENLEVLEEEILRNPSRLTVRRIHEIKRELLGLRRAIWPLREALNALLRDPLPQIRDETRPFLRDCYDHTVQIVDLIETYRELGADLTDVYLSSLSQRTNEIMRVLTVISTIFIPLTFLAGVWGMNFDPSSSPFNMPELRWLWGYPAALALMAVIAAGLLIHFRRQGWLGNPHPPPPESEEPGGLQIAADSRPKPGPKPRPGPRPTDLD